LHDVTSELQPNDTVSYCAYKGRASYFSLPDVCFFDERVDVIVDGRGRHRPTTPWSD